MLPRGLWRHVLARPGDGWTLARAGWRLRRRGWWRTPPFLPQPDERYWAFRAATVGASEKAPLTVDDVVAAARWALAQPTGR